MAKLTVFFKDKPIQSEFIDSGVIHIGRDESNDIKLDSLAVAPAHATVIIQENQQIIKQLDCDFPLIVNDEERKEHKLNNADRITIGKHAIVFSSTESIELSDLNKISAQQQTLNNEIDNQFNNTQDAGLQVMQGEHIGRVIPLKKSMTRLGHNDSGVVVITKRKGGFFISSLEANCSFTVNQEKLEDTSVKLKDNDVVVIDNIPMRFFLD